MPPLLALSLLPTLLAAEPASEQGAESPPTSGPELRGWGWAALPTLNYTSDNGFGYGAYVALFNYGPEGPGDEPYKAKIALQFYQTTLWYMDHFLKLDFPDIAGTRMRWDLETGFEAWNHAWYFGRGNFLPRLHDDELPNPDYYEYAMKSAKLYTNLRVPLGDAEAWNVLFNYRFRHAFYADEDQAYNDANLLGQDRPAGYEGGTWSQLSVGLLYDSRDQEPSPTSGMFSEFSVRSANHLWGSDWDTLGLNLTDRRWVSLDRGRRVVLANRFVADCVFGTAPFFEDWVMGGSQFVQLGGSLSMRGLPAGRYRGNLFFLMDPELRWTFADTHPFGNDLAITAVPFVDLARVFDFDKDEPDALFHVHASGGLGWRFAWNKDFLVRLDLAWGIEEYVPEGMDPSQVAPGEVEREPNFGFYLVLDHPF